MMVEARDQISKWTWRFWGGTALELVGGMIELVGNFKLFGGTVALLGGLFLVVNMGAATLALRLTASDDPRVRWWAAKGSAVILALGIVTCLAWYRAGASYDAARRTDDEYNRRVAGYQAAVAKAGAEFTDALAKFETCGRLVRCGRMPQREDFHAAADPVPYQPARAVEVAEGVNEMLRWLTGGMFATSAGLVAWLIGLGDRRPAEWKGSRGAEEMVGPPAPAVDPPSPSPGSKGSTLNQPLVQFEPLDHGLNYVDHPVVHADGPQWSKDGSRMVHDGPKLVHDHPDTLYICNRKYRLKRKGVGGYNCFWTSPPRGQGRYLGYVDGPTVDHVLVQIGPTEQEDELWKWLESKGKVRPMADGDRVIPIIRRRED